jgi:Translation initiation factor IF-3, C-terminal domain
MDYGKYKYEAAQKAKESRRKASNVSIKEMKYRPKISKGDFDTKTRKVERFLQDGHKVKVTLTFRGREMHHPELGRRILDDVVSAVEHLGKVEIFPRQDGRNMTMVLGPDRKAQAASERARRQAASEGAAEGGASGTGGSADDRSDNNRTAERSATGESGGERSGSGSGTPAGDGGSAAAPTPVTAAGPAEQRPRQDGPES